MVRGVCQEAFVQVRCFFLSHVYIIPLFLSCHQSYYYKTGWSLPFPLQFSYFPVNALHSCLCFPGNYVNDVLMTLPFFSSFQGSKDEKCGHF